MLCLSMLLTGGKFDFAKLILKNMMYVFEGNSSTSLPYGLLLTHIFTWYGVDLCEVDKYVIKDFSLLRVLPSLT